MSLFVLAKNIDKRRTVEGLNQELDGIKGMYGAILRESGRWRGKSSRSELC